ncbi:MAG: hypothetical protein H6713_28550 [Myxococcales bacterium]|nr:hypothetical protein [Myxococcales bacterium]
MGVEDDERFAFLGYEKIVESPEAWKLDAGELRRISRKQVRWAVTEKIHGANFCVLCDESGLRVAKRKALLAPGEPFFGYERPLARLEPRVFALLHRLRAEDPEVTRVYVYGELFGGLYPHPEVPPPLGVEPIQTGVYYTPDIEFCAFDVAVSRGEDEAREYLGFGRALELLRSLDILCAEPLRVCSLTEACAYPVDFETRMPARLGLPALPNHAANLAEGVVIRPMEALTVQTRKGPGRPLLKRKPARFSEDARYHQVQRWTNNAPVVAEFGTSAARLCGIAHALLLPTRLDAAISKVGRLSGGGARAARRRAEVQRLLRDEVLEELEAEADALLRSLTPEARGALVGAIEARVRELIERRER